jgi:hypothetical protein
MMPEGLDNYTFDDQSGGMLNASWPSKLYFSLVYNINSKLLCLHLIQFTESCNIESLNWNQVN